jgi:hypothetical protein
MMLHQNQEEVTRQWTWVVPFNIIINLAFRYYYLNNSHFSKENIETKKNCVTVSASFTLKVKDSGKI